MAANASETEQGSTVNEQLPGFAATAGFIANDPAKTTVIFRRFDKLALRNLLYLEARLAALENLQQTFDQMDLDLRNNEPITTAARSWEAFAVLGTSNRDGDNHSWDLPQSALNFWKFDRKEDVDDYIEHAGDNGKTIKKDPESKDKSVEKGESAGRARTMILSGLSSSQAPSKEPVAKAISSGPSTGQAALAKPIPESAPSDPSAALDPHEDHKGTAKDESDLLYDNPLGCGPQTLELLHERWDLAQAIENTLKNYQETVLRYRDMLKLEPPAPRTRNVVSDWIGGIRPASNGKEVKAAEQFFPGSSMHTIYTQEKPSSQKQNFLQKFLQWFRQTFQQEQTDDLVGIGRIAGIDLLTRYVSTWKALFIFKDKKFPYPEIDYVPERIVHITVTFLTIILAVLLVIGGIWGLYYLRVEQDSFPADLGLLSGLIVMFGVSIKLMTMASRTELFIATAGYTAVLIVFVAFQAPSHSQTFNISFNGTRANGTISG